MDAFFSSQVINPAVVLLNNPYTIELSSTARSLWGLFLFYLPCIWA